MNERCEGFTVATLRLDEDLEGQFKGMAEDHVRIDGEPLDRELEDLLIITARCQRRGLLLQPAPGSKGEGDWGLEWFVINPEADILGIGDTPKEAWEAAQEHMDLAPGQEE